MHPPSAQLTLRYTASQVIAHRIREDSAPPLRSLESPQMVAQFWVDAIMSQEDYNPDQERFVVMHLNTRIKVTGWHLVSLGLLDSVLVHPREVFRAAIVAGAHSILLAHNHPSGLPDPSEADLRTTRDLIRAGQLLKLDVRDHVIVGDSTQRPLPYASLRERGLFHS